MAQEEAAAAPAAAVDEAAGHGPGWWRMDGGGKESADVGPLLRLLGKPSCYGQVRKGDTGQGLRAKGVSTAKPAVDWSSRKL
jgi:hypothetical protein